MSVTQQLLFERMLLKLVGTVVEVRSPWVARTGVLTSHGAQSGHPAQADNGQYHWRVVAPDHSQVHFATVHIESISLADGDVPKMVVRFA